MSIELASNYKGRHRGVVVNKMDRDNVVNEFKFYLGYYVNF